jgi:hypothetical protein
LLAKDPLTAGNDFASLLLRMGDSYPLSNHEKAYLPWLSALRTMVWNLGAWEIQIERPLAPIGCVPRGVCDLFVQGGPQRRGVVEVKVLAHGACNKPRGRDLMQVGAYARLASGQGSFDKVWAAVAYVELENCRVHLFGVKSARMLVTETMNLIRAA